MHAPHESTILASKFDDREIGRQHRTKIAQCLQRPHLRIGEHRLCARSRDGRSRTGLIGRRIRRTVRGCARRASPACVDIVARRSAVGCGREEKRVCVTGCERRARWGNQTIQRLCSECGIERVCEREPRHGAVIGQGPWVLNRATNFRGLRADRPGLPGLPAFPALPAFQAFQAFPA